MTTYPLPTLSVVVDDTGISAPAYPDVLASLQASYRLIFGSDVYLEADSQDGQWLAVMARAIHDSNAAAIAVFNAFSPSKAQGAGLASVVKINGLAKKVSTNSTADVLIVGTAGTIISDGIVGDGFLNRWTLPAEVIIPVEGEITVTATATELGAIAAAPNTIIRILTPTRGWQTVTNPAAATAGAPVETDAALRRRQAVSTALPAQSVLKGIVGAVANLEGVQRYQAYENDTDAPDGDGIPAHSICLVVEGGDAIEIATAIAIKKTPGTGTFGTTSEVIIDPAGVPNTIRFYRPTVVRLVVEIDVTALPGYVSTTGAAIKLAETTYAEALPIGGDVFHTKLVAAANLANSALGATFNVTAVRLARFGDAPVAADIAIDFNEAASLDAADITLTVS